MSMGETPMPQRWYFQSRFTTINQTRRREIVSSELMNPTDDQQGDTVSRVLVLSAHETQLDRRIIAEVNTLAQSGRRVTLVSIPTAVPVGDLDDSVRLIMPAARSAIKTAAFSHLVRWIPRPFYKFARGAWRCVCGFGRDGLYMNYFLGAAPPENYDTIHCHDLNTLPAAVELRRNRFPDARLIYDSHELYPFQFEDRETQDRWSAIERRQITEADLVITVNESISKELARLYGIDRPEVLYNSYGSVRLRDPLEEADFLSHFKAGSGGLKIVFQGTFTDERNLVNLVRAVRELGESVRLFLLGGGRMEGELKSLCRRERISNTFFGSWVPQRDLLRYVRHADLGIIPYRGDRTLNNRYCTPNKLFEYIEAEVPICASDLPELKRIIRGNRIGEVYAMDTAKSIVEAINDCRERLKRGEFTEANLRSAREKYSWRRQAEKLLSLYAGLGV